MKIRTLLFAALLIIMPAVSYGQLGRLIKNTANKAVNSVSKATGKEANKEIDSAAQKKTDKMGNESEADQSETKSSSGGGGLNMGKLLANKVDLKYNEEYTFGSRLYMQTETYDKKDVIKMDIYMYFSANSPNMGMETKSLTDAEGNSVPVTMVMVMDGENKCAISLTDANGTKMGFISAVNDSIQAKTNSKSTKNSTPTDFKKTGNTRMIAGCKCDEYVYTDATDKSSGKVWFTKDANLMIDKRGWQSTGLANYYTYGGFKDGVLLASESYDDKGTLTMKSETKEINTKFPHTISVKGYPLRQVNMNQGQPKK
jgi:hypothetical protein